MRYLLLNDLHFGLKRSAGATKASIEQFHEFQLECVGSILKKTTAGTVIFIGDTFNAGVVPFSVVLDFYTLLKDFPHLEFILVQGNHDISKDRTKLSAFEFLCALMPDAVAVTEPYRLTEETVIIPHMANQALFDEAIETESETAFNLITHVNYDNKFAREPDHSLNLTPEQAAKFELVLSGHEHSKRTVKNVHMLGAQIPCNVKEAEERKFYHEWEDEVLYEYESPTLFTYTEADWMDISTYLTAAEHNRFLRVVGEATAEQARDVFQSVAKLRAKSSAFMITNSVKVGEINLGEITNFDENGLAGFDSLAALKEMLPDKFTAKLEALL